MYTQGKIQENAEESDMNDTDFTHILNSKYIKPNKSFT